MKKKSTFIVSVFISATVVLAASVFVPFSVLAEPYYKGKTIEFLGESRVGGGTDTMARITAAVIPKYIPGNDGRIEPRLNRRALKRSDGRNNPLSSLDIMPRIVR